MMFWFASPEPVTFAVSMLFIVVGSFFFTWLYNRTRGACSSPCCCTSARTSTTRRMRCPAHHAPRHSHRVARGGRAAMLVVLDREV